MTLRMFVVTLAAELTLLVGIVLGVVGGAGHDSPGNQQRAQGNSYRNNEAKHRPIMADGNGYVTSNACRECHTKQFESWHASHHRTMTQVPSPETVIADFDDHVLNHSGREFRFFKRDGKYFMSMKKTETIDSQNASQDKLAANEDKVFEVVLSTGAHHQQSFWYATKKYRTLGKIPFIWITAEKRWVPYGSIFFLPSSGLSMNTGVWNSNCIKCHVVSGKPRYQRQFWPDGMVRVTGREYNGLLETACYQRGKMSCISCHDMHPDLTKDELAQHWADDQLLPSMRENRACLQCHQEFKDETRLTRHTHHLSTSTGSNCYNCHMPHTTLGLMKASRSHTIDNPNIATTLATGRPNACNLCHLDQTLDWTAEKLEQWYQIPAPELSDQHKTVAASVVWLLEGDAGQRAIAGWHFGWRPAQEVSQTQWMAPFLAELLEDSYEVVRFIGYHSLKTLPGFRDFKYDYVAGAKQRQRDRRQADAIWNDQSERPKSADQLLIDDGGRLIRKLWQQIRNQRVDPKIILVE